MSSHAIYPLTLRQSNIYVLSGALSAQKYVVFCPLQTEEGRKRPKGMSVLPRSFSGLSKASPSSLIAYDYKDVCPLLFGEGATFWTLFSSSSSSDPTLMHLQGTSLVVFTFLFSLKERN